MIVPAGVVELAQAPPLGVLYRRAALGLLHRRPGGDLPGTTLVLRDVGIDRQRLGRRTRMCSRSRWPLP